MELYKCRDCGASTRFPRYNSPGRLLETRRGRCGEWANCFTLILRAAAFETRFVHDVTDHVWCEVWCATESRWLHVDPCEAQVDKPLVYEQGWGKALSYIFAFSVDNLEDVTWRYVVARSACRARRLDVRETWLALCMAKIRKQLWETRGILQARRQEMLHRQLLELVEFMGRPRAAAADELQGRQSGSEEWRAQREELGSMGGRAHVEEDVVIRPLTGERRSGRLQVLYDTVEDSYRRPLLKNSQELGKRPWIHDVVHVVGSMFCSSGAFHGRLGLV